MFMKFHLLHLYCTCLQDLSSTISNLLNDSNMVTYEFDKTHKNNVSDSCSQNMQVWFYFEFYNTVHTSYLIIYNVI